MVALTVFGAIAVAVLVMVIKNKRHYAAEDRRSSKRDNRGDNNE